MIPATHRPVAPWLVVALVVCASGAGTDAAAQAQPADRQTTGQAVGRDDRAGASPERFAFTGTYRYRLIRSSRRRLKSPPASTAARTDRLHAAPLADAKPSDQTKAPAAKIETVLITPQEPAATSKPPAGQTRSVANSRTPVAGEPRPATAGEVAGQHPAATEQKRPAATRTASSIPDAMSKRTAQRDGMTLPVRAPEASKHAPPAHARPAHAPPVHAARNSERTRNSKTSTRRRARRGRHC